MTCFGKKAKVDPELRFWMSVKSSRDGCWEWQGYINQNGYGFTRIRGKGWLAHRLSWLWHYGELPQGKSVCHHCDNPKCVRPDHLFVGSQTDNMQDMAAKGRHGANATLTRETAASLAAEYKMLPTSGKHKTPGSVAELAKRYGVTVKTVLAVNRREVWAHSTQGITE